ncbi:cupin [Hypericibacter adhaerens]|uniref:Cupin n=1 Tax=Hypericibacter adhaerens TaxID=2602016 RepID=A0A5J6N3X4_9PROT|nr:cupin domain-containing protein [Hypericibacter adhaerens]QEX24519.1 cupin [Hypericibacter adhaerens]
MSQPLSDTAPGLIEQLGLERHPEGGWYRETYRHQAPGGGRGHATMIYYLLEAGEVSRWHRVTDADELWLYHTGGALELTLSPDGERREEHRLGLDMAAGERPQLRVPAGCWQTARPLSLFTLVTCIVAPAFVFESFEMAPEGWQPAAKPAHHPAFSATSWQRGLRPRAPRRRR